MQLHYTNDGKPYRVEKDFLEYTKIRPRQTIVTEFVILHADGSLVIKEGYRWDGASGPTLPWKSAARPSCCHDAIYELISLGLLDKKWRKAGDKMLRRMLKEDGMGFVHRNLWYRAVRWGGGSHTRPETEVVHISPAPKGKR